MARWEVWRQDDNGNRYLIAGYADRVEALARVLAFEAGPAHKQLYWLAGPPGPVCGTAGELYTRLDALGEGMNLAGRSLEEFLRAWWLVSRPLANVDSLDLDTVAAMVAAAATVDAPPLRPAWRTAALDVADDPAGYADWEAVVLSQIADLADFADSGPLDPNAYFGVDAPRPAGSVRATAKRWYNFDPRAYLECGMDGSLGGWEEAEEPRTPVAGAVAVPATEATPDRHAANTVSWADLARLAICGQEYE